MARSADQSLFSSTNPKNNCTFRVLRYVPDPLRDEAINIGILLCLKEGESERTLVRVTRDWSRVLCIDPDADIELLRALERDLDDLLAGKDGKFKYLGFKDIIDHFDNTWSGALQISDEKGTYSEDIAAEMSRLMDFFVASRSSLNAPK